MSSSFCSRVAVADARWAVSVPMTAGSPDPGGMGTVVSWLSGTGWGASCPGVLSWVFSSMLICLDLLALFTL
jgi:hypothetical protein